MASSLIFSDVWPTRWSCKVTAYDFTKDPEERFLFPWVETTYEPLDSNGFVIPQVEELIRTNLRHLAWTMWGERFELDSPELDELYALWLDIWTLGLEEVEADTVSGSLHWSCRGAWNLTTGQSLPSEQTGQRRWPIRHPCLGWVDQCSPQ